ncbi:N-alpha-acetyltransferase 60 [Apodemus speciosus]|uniref:N-alpha-acetyltransferase 60 n=2 Tax=Murinae TaxID=39107 RepID=A0ABQ0FNI5_APOSI
MTEVVPSSALSEVSLRLLCHDDIDTVKHLCGDWFPIEYPDSWYRDITSNKKFFSLAATYRGAIVGMIVAEIKNRTKIHKEDGDILASSFSVDTQVAYILSLGVVKEFRKHGIGSLLLESLKDHISTTAQDHCKAIYLHVLTTNNTAINFYENRDFRQHHYLPYYYSIRGVLKDGFTYVLYINGGHPPWTILLVATCRPISLPQLQARCYAGSGAECALLPPGVLVLPPCPGTTQWPGRHVYIHWERALQASPLPPAPSAPSHKMD